MSGTSVRLSAWTAMFAACLIVSTFGCDDDTVVGPAASDRLYVVPADAVLPLDSTVQLTAIAISAAGDSVTNPQLEWKSSDSSIARVEPDGTVLGLAPGQARIRVTWGDNIADAEIYVSVRFRSLSLGGAHTCGITTDSLAFCWGSNEHGQLGIGESGGLATTPRRVRLESPVSWISAGTNHTCAVDAVGEAFCWGLNADGQLGFGLTESADTPVAVAGRLTFSRLAAGERHTCGFTPSGTVYCWGANEAGQLGTGSMVASPSPVAVAGGVQVKDIAAGDEHTCAVSMEEIVFCWGGNSDGQLGTGQVGGKSLVPVATAIPDTSGLAGTISTLGIREVSVGRYHSCGEGQVGYCWGANDHGQQAREPIGTSVPGPTFVRGTFFGLDVVTGDSLWNDVWGPRAGGDHSCGNNFGLYCWGDNSAGQLGDGTTESSAIPVLVLGGDWQDPALGGAHTCAFSAEGIVYCWGSGKEGQLGYGGTVDQTEPVRVAGQI